MSRHVLDKASSVTLGVVSVLARGAATETFDKIEPSCELAIDEVRGFHRTFGRGILLRDRESAEPTHSPALADYGVKGFHVSCVGEPGSLGRLVSVQSVNSVLGAYEVIDCKDPPRPSRGVGDRNLDYIINFVDFNGQRNFVKERRRG